MAKGSHVLLVLFFIFSLSLVTASATNKLTLGELKVTNMHFYFHDIVSGENPTAVKIAEAATTNQSSTGFGLLVMIDDPLTEGPEVTSKQVGRAQGLYGSASQKDIALIMALSYVFTDGPFNGSSVSVLARNPAMKSREFPIIGGTGLFRLARGYATASTYWFNMTTGDAIVEYNLTIVHY